MRRLLTTLLPALLLALPTLARAHIQMNYPPTRTNMTQNQTVAPCGGLPPMVTPTAVKTGSTLEVQWVEIIVHPGWYRISLATNPNVAFTSNVLFDNIPSVSGTTSYTQNVTLPATACPQCTLQLVQVNTSGTDSTTPSGYVEYTACADLNVDPNAPVPTNTPAAGGATGKPTDNGGGCNQVVGAWALIAVVPWLLRRRT